jgi:hypothetical protein
MEVELKNRLDHLYLDNRKLLHEKSTRLSHTKRFGNGIMTENLESFFELVP